MTDQKLIARIAQIKHSHPDNLMARHFDAAYFSSLDGGMQKRLSRIIKTGIVNENSNMGAYAMDPDDYDQFAPMLDKMIRDFHGIAPDIEIAQPHDWNTGASVCDLAAIDAKLKDVSMRVRVARNLASFPLPGAMNKEQRVEFENLAAAAFAKLAQDPDFGGQYLSITPGSAHEINSAEYDRRVAAHQMFKDMSNDKYLNVAGISNDWPHGRGMYVSAAEDFLVWVGEEDHLRIMAMRTGGNLGDLFARLHSGLTILQTLLPDFAMSDKYGAIASCPTNLGAGMRSSLHLKLPRLTKGGSDLDRVTVEAKKLGLAVRGAGGEHSAAGADGLVDISPSARLGVSEMVIMQRLYDGVATLWAMEMVA
jgi:creatine kinase